MENDSEKNLNDAQKKIVIDRLLRIIESGTDAAALRAVGKILDMERGNIQAEREQRAEARRQVRSSAK